MPPSPKTPPQEALSICKKYFIIGCFFLPWLWVVNVVYMWPLTKREDIGAQIKKYLYLSMFGAIFWLIVLVTWLTIFVTNRVGWGQLADSISVAIPKGV
ncbi:6404_t:CDS:2 [Dentiscutata erythropus]|uniref:6404_t:CDS:1 n=1 Tax=Dentiscutata erythropus TaxID=1348616 RepID=A0A9N9ETR9_9GLOM|nr:6404_t:CDS:2 [Dentiscutata erythropus]